MHGAQIRVHNRVPRSKVHIEECRGRIDSSVVDENRKPRLTTQTRDLLHATTDLVLAGTISLNALVAPRAGKAVAKIFRAFATRMEVNQDSGASRGKYAGYSRAESAGSSGDQNRFAGKIEEVRNSRHGLTLACPIALVQAYDARSRVRYLQESRRGKTRLAWVGAKVAL